MSESGNVDRRPVATSGVGRLFKGQTSIDFVGRRKIGVIISSVLIVATVVSLFAQGLNLGIDFKGGISWDVPSVNGFTPDEAEQVLADNGLSTEGARLQERSSESGDIVKVQVGSQAEAVGAELRGAFAEAAGVDVDQVNVNLVSSSWGSEITSKAMRALIIFLIVVAIFISLRFEWRMALAAIAAMVHDVLISVGIYSIFQFIVTPPTVIAFLTILGYSLYDTIVVFDRVKENEARYAAQKPPYNDVINVSMNQVLMRSINTSFSSIVPVLAMLLVGAGLLGAAVLREFGVALLVGMVAGVYSSIFVAAPLLASLRAKTGRASRRAPLVGEELRAAVVGAGVSGRVVASGNSSSGDDGVDSARIDPVKTAAVHSSADRILTHPPRPRKKKRR